MNQNESSQFIDVRHTQRRIRWGQWVIRAIVLLLAAQFVYFLISTPRFEWSVVASWLTASSILKALWTTIWLSAISMLFGIALGTLIALMRSSDNMLLGAVAFVYVWFFRGTPLLVQLILWYNLAALTPTIGLGVPFGGPTFVQWDTNRLITPITAAILGLGLNEAAYMAEIIRGGLLAVPRDQQDAAKAFGMSPFMMLRRIVLPQAMRTIIPPTGNQVISMVKATSMVSVIAMSDLLYTVQMVYNKTFQTIPMLFVAVIWYLIINSLLSVAQVFIERYFGRGFASSGGSALSAWATYAKSGIDRITSGAASSSSAHGVKD